jgi:triosephosphate isomerase
VKPLVAGNWKMHGTRAACRELAARIVRGLPASHDAVEVALFPPFTALSEVAAALAATDVTVGAQNLYPASEGAFTGEIAPAMVLDCGATRVLCGHSERRNLLREDDAFVNRKVLAALEHDILPVLCVGETLAERERGETEEVVARQLRAGLAGVPPGRASDLTIAYEPVWAIGTGRNAAPEEAEEVHRAIRAILVEGFGEGGRGIRILYGGSVKPQNARDLLARPEVNGALVGGASLDAAAFCAIVRAALG